MDTLNSLRQSQVGWIVRWMIANGETLTDIVIQEKPKFSVFYSPATNRTVILRSKANYHLLQFMDGTRKENTGYFTQEVSYSNLVTAPAELIIQYIGEKASKEKVIALNKVWLE